MIEHMSNILFALNPLLNNTGVNHPKLKEGNIVEKETMPMTKKKNFFFAYFCLTLLTTRLFI